MVADRSAERREFGVDDIRRAADRIAPHVMETPVLTSRALDASCGARLFVKAESLQVTGSFKVRGALNKVLGYDGPTLRNGIIGYSAGNHAAAVAAAGRLVGCPAVVVVPTSAPRIKVDNCRAWDAEVVFYDPATEDRAEVAATIVAERGMTFIPPFDDHAIMAGAGTAGLELAQDLLTRGVRPDAVVVSCSGGGLASGVLVAMEHHFPGIEKYIVEPRGYDKMARSLAEGQVCSNPAVCTSVMDGIAGPVAGQRPLTVLAELGVTPLTVDDDQARLAVAGAYQHLKLVAEPAGAAALAAVLSRQDDFTDRDVALVCSGGNVDPAVYTAALDLAFPTPL
ncbi:threonine ammonia-lyase [Geodermatophilus sp. URMC 61]|uniref:threonine ammonia-lyase n=1 Tax=Geodermatophilus sp. URMC 61 TaxID=3423411 RepID=UPI00406C31A0